MPKGETEVYRPAEACRIAEVAPYVLRYWETEFSALSEGRDKGSSKLYTARDVRIISRIRELLYDEGFTVAGAKKRLDGEIAEGRFDSGLAPAPPLAAQNAAIQEAEPRATEKPPQVAVRPAPGKPAPQPASRPPARTNGKVADAAAGQSGPAKRAPSSGAPAGSGQAPIAAAPGARDPKEKVEPGLDRRMVVRELKEIVRLLAR